MLPIAIRIEEVVIREDSLAVRSSRPHVRGERGEDGRRKAAIVGLASLSNGAEKRESENYEFHGHNWTFYSK